MSKPTITRMVPALGIDSYDNAVAHYIEWLGFTCDWEWREADGQPVIMSISRDGVSFMLNEGPGAHRGADIYLYVDDIHALADEWNARKPGSVAIATDPPYEIPTISIADASGNTLHFQGESPVEKDRDEIGSKMRVYVRRRIANGEPLPTPEELRDAVGSVVGLAVEVLNEFPEYQEVYRSRHGQAP